MTRDNDLALAGLGSGVTGYRTALALGGLLILAGCSGAGLQPAGDLTVTPAPVPADDTPTPDYRLAPGLAESGVVAPLALAAAHADLLRSTGYHVRIEERTTYADGRVRRRVFEGTLANRTSYRLRITKGTANGTTLERVLYADGERLYERQVTNREVRYYLPRRTLPEQALYPQDPLGSPVQRGELYVALAGTRPVINGSQAVDGEQRYHLASEPPIDDEFLAAWEFVDRISAYEFEAVVTGTGLVRSYRLAYVATDQGERRRVFRTARWPAVGTATVEEPAWYQRARNRTSG